MNHKLTSVILGTVILSASMMGCSSEQEASGATTIGDFQVDITGAELDSISDGLSVLRVTADFTNNSDTDQTFAMTMIADAYQGDVLLDNLGTSFDGLQNMTEPAAPGETLEVVFGYFIYDDSEVEDAITVEVFEFLGDESEVETETFSLSELE